MSFSLNTNITSLQAQNYLQQSSMFQAKTINEVTSGLRIVNSGDDAAGLAIANGMRSDESVLTQGIQNANNGMATLQTIDSGMNNISTLLDRARTLATESATGTLTGTTSRQTLNDEFQSVISEISRQAQAIGMDQNGTFAKSLSVFIGGGQGTTNTSATTNGSIGIDLSSSQVDAKGLGLQGTAAGYQVATGAPDTGLYDLSTGVASVSNIINDPANALALTLNTPPGTTSFNLSGAGFSGTPITVNLADVTDTNSLVSALNSGIATASKGSTALVATGITASIHTGSDGHQQLVFTSPASAFQVQAGDIIANAFMGNLTGNTKGLAAGITAATGAVGTAGSPGPPVVLSIPDSFVASGTQQTGALAFVPPADQVINITALDASGNAQTTIVTLSSTVPPASPTGASATSAVAAINAALQGGDLAGQGIVATSDVSGNITFSNSSASSSPFTVNFAAPIAAGTGFTALGPTVSTVVGSGSQGDISTVQGATNAVNQLAVAVQNLGAAQAVVGKGENLLNYAVELAQSQLTNEAAAESHIRDANLATEAANLTKAQILMQAGTAALAQANTAPQALLSLLK